MSATYDLPIEKTDFGSATTYTITLDGEDFTIGYTYNTRIDTWFLTISNINSDTVLQEIPLLLNVNPLVQLYQYTELLQYGDIQVFDDSGDGQDPTRDSFGKTKTLIYESILDA